jgi:hypothetical protein
MPMPTHGSSGHKVESSPLVSGWLEGSSWYGENPKKHWEEIQRNTKWIPLKLFKNQGRSTSTNETDSKLSPSAKQPQSNVVKQMSATKASTKT